MKMQDNYLPFQISGKFGDMVGRVINGKQYFSKMPGPRKGKPSMAELGARKKFSMAIRFLKPILPILRKYDEPILKKGFNKATSLLIRHAVQGEYPDLRIDYPQVVLGEGTLPNPDKYQVESPAKGLLEFTWSMERMKRLIGKSDRIFVVVCCEFYHQFLYEPSGAERKERQYLMDVSDFSGRQVHIWFGFVSADGGLVSTSVYGGSIHVL